MTRRSARSFAVSLTLGSLVTALAVTLPALLWGQDVKQTSRDVKPPARVDSKTGASPLDEPLRLALKAREKARTIQDYTAMFIKREQDKNGQLLPTEFIELKTRSRPFSVYLKWQKPYDGREAIYVEGQNKGKLMVHSTGAEKVVAGTLALDPRSERAMENSRHDITEAGIAKLIEQLITRWEAEKKLGQTQIEVKENAKVDGRTCWLVKTTQPNDPRHYSYYRSKVFFDKEHGLPIRFEGYDWPRRGSSPDGDLLEEYTYRELKFNVGLTAADFSTDNPKYNFGRL